MRIAFGLSILLGLWGCNESKSREDFEYARINILNKSDVTIESILIQGFGDTAPRNEQLASPLLPGETKTITVIAPKQDHNIEGSRWRFQLTWQELGAPVIADMDKYAYQDKDGRTKFRIPKSVYDASRQMEDTHAYGNFTCLHAGEVVNWDFDEKSVSLCLD